MVEMPILDITFSRPSRIAAMVRRSASAGSMAPSWPAAAMARAVSSARYGFTAAAP